MRAVARDDGDPLAARRKEKRDVPTFAKAAEQVHAGREASFKNPKHAAQWLQTLVTYANPVFGNVQLA